MLMLWRNCGKGVRIPVKSLYSQAAVAEPVCQPPPLTNTESPWTSSPQTAFQEGFQDDMRSIAMLDAKRLLSIATEHRSEDVSVKGIQENYSCLVNSTVGSNLSPGLGVQDAYTSVLEGINSHVSLHGCMQSNVPHPYSPSSGDDSTTIHGGYSSCHNMPGYSNRSQDKYTMGALHQCHPSRHFSTSALHRNSVQGTQQRGYRMDETLEDPSPQGIQGDDCVRFKLWMENCQRYSLPNCDEQMQALRTGRKTLAEVFMEQQQIIEKVAEDWRRRHYNKSKPDQISTQGVQDTSYNFEFHELNDPCPQGLQGDDCANYRVWSHNCKALGFGNCADQVLSVRKGQKTLQDIFDEQDGLIRQIVKDFQQKRKYSTSSSNEERP